VLLAQFAAEKFLQFAKNSFSQIL